MTPDPIPQILAHLRELRAGAVKRCLPGVAAAIDVVIARTVGVPANDDERVR